MECAWVCINCTSIYKQYYRRCNKCGGYCTIVNYPKELIQQQQSKLVNAAQACRNMEERHEISGFPILHAVSKHFSLILWGKPGSGKSYFSLGLAKELSRKNKVLYLNVEEDTSDETMHIKMDRLELKKCPNLFFFHTTDKKEAIDTFIESRSTHLFIDSISTLGLNKDDINRLKKRVPGVLGMVLHVTKSGKYKGSSDVAHDCDIVIKVLRGGKATAQKNRFDTDGENLRQKINFGTKKAKEKKIECDELGITGNIEEEILERLAANG